MLGQRILAKSMLVCGLKMTFEQLQGGKRLTNFCKLVGELSKGQNWQLLLNAYHSSNNSNLICTFKSKAQIKCFLEKYRKKGKENYLCKVLGNKGMKKIE